MFFLKHQDDPNQKYTRLKKEKATIIPTYKDLSFDNFLNFFPEVTLPISITSEIQRFVNNETDPLSSMWAAEFLVKEGGQIDEYTEYAACFRLPKTKGFYALVYWQAGLEGNAYKLITISPTGMRIDEIELAGTKYGAEKLIQSVCTITDTLMISRVDGQLDAESENYNASQNAHRQIHFQVAPEGDIITL